ncbi:hypothetical protein UQ69_25000, partial [Shigella sonnei]
DAILFQEGVSVKLRLPQFGLCMDLALVTGQREGDLAAMRWEDIRDGRLYVEQQKTGAKIRILRIPLYSITDWHRSSISD